jgi:hypothetical protein
MTQLKNCLQCFCCRWRICRLTKTRSARLARIDNVGFAAGNLQYLIDYPALIEVNKRTVNKIKQEVFNGETDEPVSAFPAFPAAAPPNPLVAG